MARVLQDGAITKVLPVPQRTAAHQNLQDRHPAGAIGRNVKKNTKVVEVTHNKKKKNLDRRILITIGLNENSKLISIYNIFSLPWLV